MTNGRTATGSGDRDPHQSLILAIDAGSTKTDVALVDGRGQVLAVTRGPGLSESEPMDSWIATLEPLVERVGRVRGGDVAGRTFVSACLAHIDLPEEEEQFAEVVLRTSWADEVVVHNDTFAVLRSGVWGGGAGVPAEGVAVVCGTGINCVGVGRDGRQARFLAFGDISGDWGGGNDLGMAALRSAMRAEDGRAEPTELREALLRHLGLSSMREVAIRLRDGRLTSIDVRHCTPVLLAVAAAGDAVADALVRRQGAEICAMTRVAMRELGLLETGTTVVLGGSVLAARNAVLLDSIRHGIAAFSSASSIEVADVPPLAGAALLGLDRLGITDDVERAVRRAFAAAPSAERGLQQPRV